MAFVEDGFDAEGRSPRMRGSQQTQAAQSLAERSIPAHAGKPGWSNPPPLSRVVDPRACGEAAAAVM
ncbi:hypothetical protein PC39_12857 [Salinisphaera sp. PC39]